ncbi:MAG: hypothetical protein M3Q31_25405 [Actinomycetota bacterium]|nr:hypothetical protein [Actinomycetota bacterium]
MEASAPPAPAGTAPAYGRADLDDARRLRPRRIVKALARGNVENDILTYATGISFQVFFALIPLGLLAPGGTGTNTR